MVILLAVDWRSTGTSSSPLLGEKTHRSGHGPSRSPQPLSSDWRRSEGASRAAGPATSPESRGRSARKAWRSAASTSCSMAPCVRVRGSHRAQPLSAPPRSRSRISTTQVSRPKVLLAQLGGPRSRSSVCLRRHGPDGRHVLPRGFRAVPRHPIPRDGAHAPAARRPHAEGDRCRHASSSGRGFVLRRAECEAAAHELGIAALRDATVAGVERLGDETIGPRARHVVTENLRVLEVASLLRRDGAAESGPMLTASHASLRDDFEVSTPELDAAVAARLRGGALGARMTGAGFGGCAIALVPSDAVSEVDRRVSRLPSAGGGSPHSFAVTPTRGEPASRSILRRESAMQARVQP